MNTAGTVWTPTCLNPAVGLSTLDDQTDGSPSPMPLHPHFPLCLLGDDEHLCVSAERRYLSSLYPLVAKLEADLGPGVPEDANAWVLGEDSPSDQS